jgi:hypothetical protein
MCAVCCVVLRAGVKGIVLEAFGVGNFPDLPQQGWVPWLRQQTRKGLQVWWSGLLCCLGPNCLCPVGPSFSAVGQQQKALKLMSGARLHSIWDRGVPQEQLQGATAHRG